MLIKHFFPLAGQFRNAWKLITVRISSEFNERVHCWSARTDDCKICRHYILNCPLLRSWGFSVCLLQELSLFSLNRDMEWHYFDGIISLRPYDLKTVQTPCNQWTHAFFSLNFHSQQTHHKPYIYGWRLAAWAYTWKQTIAIQKIKLFALLQKKKKKTNSELEFSSCIWV